MAIIQPIFTAAMVDTMDQLCAKGKVKINGDYKNYSMFKTVRDGNKLRKYLYLETEIGYVEEAQLLSINNDVLAIKPVEIEKQEDGLVIAFEFELVIREVNA
ncbi:hypothetical protein [Solibacillus isronensis]|uniref:hypothetical protein n=1 Tax=Solibacillus isronensis TaxID=412383 RepID=UPI0039A2A234